MRIKRHLITLIFLLLGVGFAHSQDSSMGMSVTYRLELPEFQDSILVPEYISVEPTLTFGVEKKKSKAKTVAATVVPEVKTWTRQLHVKTNVLGLGLGIANAAVEFDLGKHWSFNLPVYYSAWDYFKTTIKFRTLAVQPEFRYWFKPENEGWFVGAHFGYASYNIALDGDYRYQDHDRETPAMGGGLAFGYRTHISKNKRWKMEFTLGGGYYPLQYDKFHNTPNVKDGLMVESCIEKNYLGLDQASVSFLYTFDLKKKGGKR